MGKIGNESPFPNPQTTLTESTLWIPWTKEPIGLLPWSWTTSRLKLDIHTYGNFYNQNWKMK